MTHDLIDELSDPINLDIGIKTLGLLIQMNG